MVIVPRQDIGIWFCDKVHLECERSTVQGFLLPTHQLWHRTKWIPTPNCTCESNLEIWQHCSLCWLKELPTLVMLQENSAIELCHSHNTKKIVGCYLSTLPIILWSTFSHCRIHILCPFLHNPIIPGLTHFRLQTIVMRHCEEKVVHVVEHVVFSVGNCDVHVQILTCLDWILLEHQYVEQDFPKSQFAYHFVELLGAAEKSSKQPKHYHVAQWVHTYVLVCLWASWGEGFLLHSSVLVSERTKSPWLISLYFVHMHPHTHIRQLHLWFPFPKIYNGLKENI
jgi:hypothetical protein